MIDTELNKELVSEYPFIDPRYGLDPYIDMADYDYSFTLLDDMPVGWKKRFGRQLCDDIKNALVNDECLDKYRVIQVKEKYGSLRWYDNGVCDKVRHEIIPRYESLSARVCCECGEDAKYMSNGWICPYCERHVPNKDFAVFIGE